MLETGIKLQFDGGEILNKYSRRDIIVDQSLNAIELIQHRPEKENTISHKCDWVEGLNGKIQENNEEYNFYWCEEDFFFRKFTVSSGVTSKIEKIKPKTIKKEGFEMGLSLGTWILLIIVMVIIAKVAHKISLKTIFTPTKQVTKHVKKEWEDS